MPFAATWMEWEGIMLSEIRQKKTNTVWYHFYVESKKHNKLVTRTKKKQIHRYREQTSGCQWEKGRGHIRMGAKGAIMRYMKSGMWTLWKLYSILKNLSFNFFFFFKKQNRLFCLGELAAHICWNGEFIKAHRNNFHCFNFFKHFWYWIIEELFKQQQPKPLLTSSNISLPLLVYCKPVENKRSHESRVIFEFILRAVMSVPWKTNLSKL